MTMSKLFHSLVSEGVFADWAELLDWLFDENRFPKEKGWTSGHVSAFTKRVKVKLGLKNANYTYDAACRISFPSNRPAEKTIMHSKGDGEARDLIRHIRNGIAHGKANLSKPNGELYIEIFDYNAQKTSKTQTAYMFIPLESLFIICKTYLDAEKSFPSERKKRTRKKNAA